MNDDRWNTPPDPRRILTTTWGEWNALTARAEAAETQARNTDQQLDYMRFRLAAAEAVVGAAQGLMDSDPTANPYKLTDLMKALDAYQEAKGT